jgi:osmotically inducible lipoprotein OsmB
MSFFSASSSNRLTLFAFFDGNPRTIATLFGPAVTKCREKEHVAFYAGRNRAGLLLAACGTSTGERAASGAGIGAAAGGATGAATGGSVAGGALLGGAAGAAAGAATDEDDVDLGDPIWD